MVRPTVEDIKKVAEKYTNRTDFFNKDWYYHKKARNLGILDLVCSHMPTPKFKGKRKPKNFWNNIDRIHQEALKYTSRGDFYRYSKSAYNAGLRLKCLDIVCKHMPTLGNRHIRYVYCCLFPDKAVYFGFTYDLAKREKAHRSEKCTVSDYINKSGLDFKLIILTESPVDIKTAASLEKDLISNEAIREFWLKENNFIVLNKTKGGEIGGNREFHDKISVITSAQYNKNLNKNISTWKKENGGMADHAKRNNYFDEIKFIFKDKGP